MTVTQYWPLTRSGRRSRPSRTKTTRFGAIRTFPPATGYLVLAGLLGGGPMMWSAGYAVLTLATIVLAALFAWQGGFSGLKDVPLLARAALAGVIVLPLLQIVPLPPAIWQALPGQGLRIAVLARAGLADSWQPLTLEPASTALVAIMAVGFATLVGSLLRLSDAQFRTALLAGVALVLLGIAIGLLQVVSDGQPHLQVDNMGGTMLGVFANKNHMAMALACSILIFGLVVSRDLFKREQRRLVVAGYIFFVFVCIVTTNSRAGLGLGLLAAAIVFADLARGVALRWRIATLVALVLLVVALLSSSAFEQVSGRVGDVDSDLRWRFAAWSWPLAERYALTGSGFGSFATLFAANEQLAWVKPTFVNAAHDDYLQLLIEAGWAGAALLVLMLAAVVRCIGACWSMPRRDPHRMEMVMGFAIIVLFALHSGLDYPLRRPAAWIYMALGLAAVFRGHAAWHRSPAAGSMQLDER